MWPAGGVCISDLSSNRQHQKKSDTAFSIKHGGFLYGQAQLFLLNMLKILHLYVCRVWYLITTAPTKYGVCSAVSSYGLYVCSVT